MSRDDSFLYSGASTKTIEARKAITEEKEADRQKLLPSADVVMAALQKEKTDTELQILSFIGVGAPKTQVKETLASLNLYDQSMTTLINKMKNILRKAEK